MPPANPNVVTIRPRSLAVILADLTEAQRDWDQAVADLGRELLFPGESDADDRANEAETRCEDLRAEFDAKFVDLTGLTVERLMKAREGAIL
jgi:hypothetical protein